MNYDIGRLAGQSGIPVSELHIADMILKGVSAPDAPPQPCNGRHPLFDAILDYEGIHRFITLAIRPEGETPYAFAGSFTYQGQELPITVTPFHKNWISRFYTFQKISPDTYDTTYLRLNPRDSCDFWCRMCMRTYDLAPDAGATIEPDKLLQEIEQAHGRSVFSSLRLVNIMTGSFGSEREAIECLDRLVHGLRQRGFEGALYTADAEIRSKEAMRTMRKLGFDAYHYPWEIFERRTELMPVKGKVGINTLITILADARDVFGASTGIYYLAGLDSLAGMDAGFKSFQAQAIALPSIFMPYTSVQDTLYSQDAKEMGVEYLIEARNIMRKYGFTQVNEHSNNRLFG